MADCKRCGNELANGQCDACGEGKRSPVYGQNDTPPAPVDVIAGVIRNWQVAGKPWPRQLPNDPLAAAKRWMEIQQPRAKSESCRRVPVAGTENKTRWIDPYTDRIKNTLWAFLAPEVTPTFRDWIVAAASEKIWWRGDDEKMFSQIVSNTYEYRENPEKFRKEGAMKARAVLAIFKKREAA